MNHNEAQAHRRFKHGKLWVTEVNLAVECVRCGCRGGSHTEEVGGPCSCGKCKGYYAFDLEARVEALEKAVATLLQNEPVSLRGLLQIGGPTKAVQP